MSTHPATTTWNSTQVPYPTEPLVGNPQFTSAQDHNGIHHHPDPNRVVCTRHPNTSPAPVPTNKPIRLCLACLHTHTPDNSTDNDPWAYLTHAQQIHELTTTSPASWAQPNDHQKLHSAYTRLLQTCDQLASLQLEQTLEPDTHHVHTHLTSWANTTISRHLHKVSEHARQHPLDMACHNRMLTYDLLHNPNHNSRTHPIVGRRPDLQTLITKHLESRLPSGDIRQLADDTTHHWLQQLAAGHPPAAAQQQADTLTQQRNHTHYNVSDTDISTIIDVCTQLHIQLLTNIDRHTRRLQTDTSDPRLGNPTDAEAGSSLLVCLKRWWRHTTNTTGSRKDAIMRAIIARNLWRSTRTTNTLWMACSRLEALWVLHHGHHTTTTLLGPQTPPDADLARRADLIDAAAPIQLAAAQHLT